MKLSSLASYGYSFSLSDIAVGSCYNCDSKHSAECVFDHSQCPDHSYGEGTNYSCYAISVGYEFSDGTTCDAMWKYVSVLLCVSVCVCACLHVIRDVTLPP